ncbi:hypothetical protein FBQ82_10060 [Anaerolineae bacterium CFX7]|nr:hypothetical protein [Anaerolineae bacterium CFX7]
MTMRLLFAWRLWALASLGVLALLGWFGLQILFASPSLRVQYTPDDAYYYFQLAKNLTRFGTWTFDGGVSVTSGFHLIHAYWLALVFAVTQPTTENFVSLGLVSSCATTLLAGGMAWGIGWRIQSTVYFMTLTWLASTSNVAFNSISATEWSLTVLCALLYYLAVAHWFRDTRKRVWLTLFALGMLGTLARSDFGLIPLGLFSGAAFVYLLTRQRGMLFQTFVGLCGAAFGVLLVFWHNYLFTGEITQSSALMKAYWAQLYPIRFLSSVQLPPRLLGLSLGAPLDELIFCVVIGAATSYLLLVYFRVELPRLRQNQTTPRGVVLVIASTFTLGSYLIFYANNAAVQPWYTGVLLVPAFVLVYSLGNFLNEILRPHTFLRATFGVFVVVIVAHNVLTFLPIGSTDAPWPYQRALQNAGKFLAAHPLDARVGAWNSGILGYYQGGTLVNLDGLVNNDIYAYAVSNTLPTYLSQKQIRYLVDYENVMEAPYMRQRGGYDDPSFISKLYVRQVLDANNYGYGRLALYEIAP